MTADAMRRQQPEVLAEILAAYGPEIGGVAYLILRDRAAAEDVVMETLLTALERAHELRDPSALRPWLLRVATNHALGMRRRAARIVLVPALPDGARIHVDSDIVERTVLWHAIGELPPRMRAAIVLHYHVDLPVEGVAAAMGVSPNTVKTQLRKALEKMRAALAEKPLEVMDHA